MSSRERRRVSSSRRQRAPTLPGAFPNWPRTATATRESTGSEARPKRSPSPPQHMFIRYGDGEIVTGPMGFADITVGGGNATIARQQVCLANETYWYGNNVTSGLMGLAFPSITNAYIGPQYKHDPGSQVAYAPLFTTMVS